MTRFKPLSRLLPTAGALLLATAAWGLGAPQAAKKAIPPPAAAVGKKVDPPAAANSEYVLGPGDMLAIDVYHEPEVSRTLPVRPDGRLSLPLVGEIQAQGLTTNALQAAITERLQKYIDHPAVTVMVQDAQSHRYNVLGMVTKPGSYPLDHPTTVLDAIAEAGGLGEFAHGNKIYVIRKRASDGVEIRFNFNYKQVSLGLHPEQNIEIKDNDIIVIP